ncbi:MAG: hypothetical protein FWD36_00995 [Treponema sp.]|nr:hypothetical protein [Treponema sp.]
MNENRSSGTLDHLVNPFSDNEPGTFDGLNAKTEWQIKYDYLQNYLDTYVQPPLTIDDFQIYDYFGNYNGYEIVVFLTDKPVLLQEYLVRINDRKVPPSLKAFQFPRYPIMRAWKQDANSGMGNFYAIQDAYDTGLLAWSDIQSMLNLYYGKTFEGLDAETERLVRADIDFDYYLGTYNGYVIIMQETPWAASHRVYIGGFLFHLPNMAEIFAWKQDEESGSSQLYMISRDLGFCPYLDYNDFLVEDDIRSIFERHVVNMRN